MTSIVSVLVVNGLITKIIIILCSTEETHAGSENDHIEKSGSSLQLVVLKMCHNRRVLIKNKSQKPGRGKVFYVGGAVCVGGG